MMEWPPKMTSFEARPMSDEEAERIDKVLEESRELGKRILVRRKGKAVPSSWKLIRQARKERSQRV